MRKWLRYVDTSKQPIAITNRDVYILAVIPYSAIQQLYNSENFSD